MEKFRKIYINVYGDGTMVPSDDTIGYTGDNLSTTLVFKLPENLIDSNYIYTINFEDGNGNGTVGAIMNSDFTFAVPNALTATNTLKAELLVLCNNNVIFNSSVINFKIHSGISIPNETQNKYIGLLEETLQDFQQLLTQLGEEDLSKLKGVISVEKTETSGLTDTYTVTYTNGTQSTFLIQNGAKGDKGDKGDTGDKGEQGPQGPQGDKGEKGDSYIITPFDRGDIAQLAAAKIKPIVKTTLDNPLTVKTEYYLGEQTEVNLVYPQTANLGDCIYVNFISSETAATVISQNCIGLDSFVPNANSICEIHAQYNGRWVCLASQTEVTV